MGLSLFRVRWRDGSVTEDVDYDESMRLIKERPNDWAGVQPMEYGKNCNPDNEKLREKAWGTKKK